MDKKSMGEFIAVLRKANGMTQKDLAEKLGVSDKSVSRWERDECAPDISLLPIIAELFGITTDELIRGERKINDEPQSEYQEKKGKKMLDHLLHSTLLRFTIQSFIVIGIALLGILVAALCNFAFFSAATGFWIAIILLVGAVATETVLIIIGKNKIMALADENIDFTVLKRSLVRNALISFSCIAVLTTLIFPLAPFYNRSGLSSNIGNWGKPIFVIPFIISILVSALGILIIWTVFFGDKSPKKKALRKLKLITILICAGVLLLVVLAEIIGTSVYYNTEKYNLSYYHTYSNIDEWCQETGAEQEYIEALLCQTVRGNFYKCHYYSGLLDKYDFIRIEYNGINYMFSISNGNNSVKGNNYSKIVEGETVIEVSVPVSDESTETASENVILTVEEILSMFSPSVIILTEEEIDHYFNVCEPGTFSGPTIILTAIICAAIATPVYFIKRKKILK